MTASRVIEIIHEECDWILRYPRIPELTVETSLDWMSPVDRVCVQMRLDEEFGIEIPSLKMEAAQSVQDIINTVGLYARIEEGTPA